MPFFSFMGAPRTTQIEVERVSTKQCRASGGAVPAQNTTEIACETRGGSAEHLRADSVNDISKAGGTFFRGRRRIRNQKLRATINNSQREEMTPTQSTDKAGTSVRLRRGGGPDQLWLLRSTGPGRRHYVPASTSQLPNSILSADSAGRDQ